MRSASGRGRGRSRVVGIASASHQLSRAAALHSSPWGQRRRSSYSRRRAATARASTGPCRRSSARSSCTARRCTSARRSSTTRPWSSSCASAARCSSIPSRTCRRAPRWCSPPTGWRPASTPTRGERALDTIDATCPLVTKVHVEAKRFAADGYTIVLIGHAGHEEVEGTMGEAPEHIVLVQTEEDVDAARGARSRSRGLHLPDDPVGGRDAGDHQPPAPALPGDRRSPHRRHLLRDDQPPGRGQAAGRRSAIWCW